jgi:hypothetical protein
MPMTLIEEMLATVAAQGSRHKCVGWHVWQCIVHVHPHDKCDVGDGTGNDLLPAMIRPARIRFSGFCQNLPILLLTAGHCGFRAAI